MLPGLYRQDTFTPFLNFEVGHFAWHFLFVSFFLCGYERNSIQTASLSHFIFLIHSVHNLFFLSSRRRQLLSSCKHWLFYLHIQHATCCLFERWILVGSSETAVCRFCLSISLQVPFMIWYGTLRLYFWLLVGWVLWHINLWWIILCQILFIYIYIEYLWIVSVYFVV